MQKNQLNKIRQKATLLENFIESLGRKQVEKCKQLIIQMEGSSHNARKCLQIVQHAVKVKGESSKQIKQLAAKIKSLNDDIERINRVKGLKLTQDQKTMNDTLSVVQMLNNGLYIEASRTAVKPFRFIQQLVEYNSLKQLLKSIQTRQRAQEVYFYGGEQYRQIKHYIEKQDQKIIELSNKLYSFLRKMDGIQNEQQWVRPKQFPDFVFDEIQNIQTRLRSYRNQIRSFNQILSDVPSQPSQFENISRSTNYQIKIDDQQRQISAKIRQIQRKIKNNSNKSLLKKTNIEMLTQIEAHITKLQQNVDILSKKQNMNEEQIEDKIKIISLQDRVKQLYDEKMRFLNKLGYNMKQLNQLLSQSRFQQQFEDDIDEMIRIFQSIVKQLVWQHQQRLKKIEYILKQRDNYKNQYNKLNLISNISEDYQILQQNLMRSSTQDQLSVHELTLKIQQLQLKIRSLQCENNQMNKVMEQKMDQIQFLKKTIRDRQTELFDLKSEIYQNQKQTKQKLKNQVQKIKQLQFMNSQSLMNSRQSSNEQNMLNESMVGDFLKGMRQVPANEKILLNSYRQQEMGIQTQLDLQQMIEEKVKLLKQINELKQKNTSLHHKIERQQIEIKQVREELQKAQLMLQQAYNINASTPAQDNSLIASSLIKSKSQEKDKICHQCQKYVNQNIEINNKFTQSKARINQLYSKNLVLIKQNETLKKTNRQMNSKVQLVKAALCKVQEKLQQSQKNAEKLRQALSQTQKTKIMLQKENKQLKSNIISQVNKPEISRQAIEKPIQMTSNNQLSNRLHLFTAKGIFEEREEAERLFLINTLQKEVGTIYQTKFLYSFDTLNKVNFHRYIDNHKHLVIIIKTIYGKLIAAYSESEVSINGTYRGLGLLLPLWSRQVFSIIEGKKPVTYDDYFLIFGNSQIRLKSQQDRVFSNFGIANGYFNNEKKKVQHLLGEPQREICILTYEIYSVVFQNDRF